MLPGVLAGLAAGALWGLDFVVPAWLPHWPPVDLAVGRMLAYAGVSLGAMLVVPLLRSRASPLANQVASEIANEEADAVAPTTSLWPDRRQALAAFVLSVLGFWGYYALLVLSLRDAGPEVPTLIIGTIPLWVMVLGKPGDLRWRALLPGLLLTAAGLALMTKSVQAGGGLVEAPAFWRGVLLAGVAMVFWTAFALLNSAWLRRNPQVSVTAWANWLGLATGVGTLGLWAVAGSPLREILARPDLVTYLVLCGATGFGAAWLATILWNEASRRLSASLCGQLIVSETLFALLYAFVLEGRWPMPAQWLAAVLFTLGILASIKAQR
jgi:drug/metabolite transporter (DMT)-like permease